MNPLNYIDSQRELLLKTYHALHSLAEPSWQEKKTSEYIQECLKKAGIQVQTFQNHYGFIAEIPGDSAAVVALRADMDALLQEVNGKIRANHSCGHDAHSSMVLFTALAIAESKMVPKHTLRFIFQPAEEKGEGALQMMKEGALEKVRWLFGVHLRPQQEIPFGKAAPVIQHGAAGTIQGIIKGIQAHAARPKEGINAIEAAALLVQKLQQAAIDTEIPYSIKMTQLETNNTAANIIPETAVFALDARAQSNAVMDELKLLAQTAMKQVMKETGAKVSWALKDFVPAAAPNNAAVRVAEAAISSIIGKKNVLPSCVSQGGEDFHYYSAKNPLLFSTMIGLGCGLSPGLHHPQMKFNLEALIYGTKILIQTILAASEA